MTIIAAVLILIAALIAAVSVDRGFWLIIDRIALALHRAAVRARARQANIEASLRTDWQREAAFLNVRRGD